MRGKALTHLLVAVFFKQLAWSAFIPLWQTPDEQAHFAEVSLCTETGNQEQAGKNLSKEIFTAEKIMGTDRDELGNNKFTYHPEYRTPYALTLEQTITNQPLSSRTEFVKKEATGYPPLYYQLASLIERVIRSASLFDRVFAVRVFTDLTLVGLVWVAYQIGKILFNESGLALILAVLVGFQPMLTFVQSGVSSDNLFNLVFAAFLLAGVRLIVKGINVFDLVFLAGTILLANLTKPQANVMLFIAGPLLVGLLFRDRKFNPAILVIILAAVAFASRDLFWRLSQGWSPFPETNVPVIAPQVNLGEHLVFTFNHTFREVLPWYWGVFRWLSLGLPMVIRKVTNWLTIISFLGFGWYLSTARVRDRKFWAIVFCAGCLVVYFAALTAFDYSFRRTHGFSFGIQGRYFFPVVISQMVIFLVGLKPLSRVLAAGMIVLNVVVFFWVTGSYYSPSFPLFFIEAGQYKPLWLKFPVNLVILSLDLLWSLFLFQLIMKKPSLRDQ